MSGLPRGWVTSRLGTFGEVYCGQSSTASDVNAEGRGTPYVTGPEQWTGSALELNKWTTTPKRVVPEGCIFITVKGAGVGKMFPGVACAIGRDVYAYEPSRELSYPFVMKALAYTVNTVIREARGDIPGLSKEHITDHIVPLPPLAEQKRIVAKLDALFAKSARARIELARIETLVSRYKQAVLSKAFSGELTNSGVPTDWPTVKLEEIAEVGTGATPKRGNAEYYAQGTIPWVTSGAVNQGLILQADEFITELAIRETNCKVFAAGTLLVAMYGEGKTRGKVAMLGLDAATNQALAAVRIRKPEISAPQYVYLFLQSVYLSLREEAAGGVQPNLNLSIVKAIQLPLPSLGEQHEIVRRIESVFARIDRLAAEAARALALVGKLDEAILTKAFHGELVPQDENDEPAEKLLERIRSERQATPKAGRGRGKV